MDIQYGLGKTPYGPGVSIALTGDEIALAIVAWLATQGVHVHGPRTVTVNNALCQRGHVYVDPAGSVVTDRQTFSGRGPKG